MPNTKDLGRLFIHPILLIAGAPVAHIAPTQELDPPFRISAHSLVVRLWPSRNGFVLGWWKDVGLTEAEAVQRAYGAHGTDLLDDTGHLLDQFDLWGSEPSDADAGTSDCQ